MIAKSYIFVPGDSEKKLSKAQDLGADAIILCLEDAVAEANKPKARAMAKAYLTEHQGNSNAQLWVRVNPFSSPHILEDLVQIMAGKPYGVFLPKPSNGGDFKTLDNYLTVLEVQNDITPGTTKIMSVTESCIGTIHQGEFATASPRLSGMCWGAEDMSADLGASDNKDENGNYFLVHQINRANCLVVCNAGNMQAVDGICSDYKNEAMLRDECKKARAEGFTGKIAIHPSQIAVINEMFSPSEEEISYARRVIQAFADAPDQAGTVGLDGKMLDFPHLKRAKRLLNLAGAE
jgi:citrate lyase subunit beta/citryl-CoA lyase